MDIVFHMLLPLLLLKFLNVESKWVYLLLPLTFVMDLGKFFGYQKELNSIFVALLILFFIYIFAKRSSERNLVLGISAFYLFSHLLLDLSYYQQLLWPFSQTYYWITFRVLLNGFMPVLDYSIRAVESMPIQPDPAALPEPISTLGFGLLALLLVAAAFKRFSRR